ncbi:MAG: hypothetical protein LH481_02720, partial [Burkholderiales bacterium]|nr:hypothetical protein [Burkholderiales bacterium]
RMLRALERAKVVAEWLCTVDFFSEDGTVLMAKESHKPRLEMINDTIAIVKARHFLGSKA